MSPEQPGARESGQTRQSAGDLEPPSWPSGTAGPQCPACGGEQTEEGFLEDRGEGSGGSIRWIVGPLETGIFGGAKRMGRTRLDLTGRRCVECGHVALFANDRI